MQKKNYLKAYAYELYNKHKDDKNLRVVKNIFWESLEELIDNYGQFMSTENIDKVFETRYTIKIEDAFSSFRRGYKYFDKNGSLVKNENYNITISYPVYENEQSNVKRWQNEFDLELDEYQAQFIQDYLFGDKNLQNDEVDISFQKIVKENVKIILQHEMSHAMSNIEIIEYNHKKKKIFQLNFIERHSSYVHNIWGGLHCYSDKLDKDGKIQVEYARKKDFMLLHEGITEYIAYNMKKEKILSLAGFDHYGDEYILPAYTPLVWLAGCINALNDNFLIKAYYNGTEVAMQQNNLKQIKRKSWYFLRLLQETADLYSDMREDVDILFELEDKLANLKSLANSLGISNDRLQKLCSNEIDKLIKNINYEDLWKEVLYDSNDAINTISVVELYAKTKLCYDDMVKDYECIEGKHQKNLTYIPYALSNIAKYLYNDYEKKLSKNTLNDQSLKEFHKCFFNLLDFEHTWKEYLAYEDSELNIENEKALYDNLKNKYLQKIQLKKQEKDDFTSNKTK